MSDTPPHLLEPSAAVRPAGARRSVLLLIMLFALVCVGLMTPLPFQGKLGSAVGDLVHAPLFAVLAFCSYRLARRQGRNVRSTDAEGYWTAAIVWVLMVTFGGLTELAQGYVGRGASWWDAGNDALGAAGGVLLALTLERSRQIVRFAGVLLSIAIVLVAQVEPLGAVWEYYQQRHEMPLLASFERPGEMVRWSEREAKVRRVESHATAGRWSLRVDLERGKFPGITLYEPPPDWSSYGDLVFDIDVESGQEKDAALELIVKIEDEKHNRDYKDRFHQTLRLTPGRHEVRIPLADVKPPNGRPMDLAHIQMLQLFVIGPIEPRTFYLDNVRLE